MRGLSFEDSKLAVEREGHLDELFGAFFDFDDDGVIDDFEHATELATFTSMIEDEEERRGALENAGINLDDEDL